MLLYLRVNKDEYIRRRLPPVADEGGHMAALYAVIGFAIRRNHAQSAELDSDDVAHRKRKCALFGLTPPPHSPAACS